MSFPKKILAMLLLAIMCAVLAAPVFAQTEAPKEPPTVCWTKKLCKGQWVQTAESKKQCGPFEKALNDTLGYCYAAPPNVNLQVSIGGKNTVAGLANYIDMAYKYLIGIVSFVAIIMIMVGGLRWVTAGSGSGVAKAKETIFGAVVGLFLTMGSYVLLQTVNPALTKLELPPIKMIRQTALTKAGECGGQKGTLKLGQQCKTTCDCEQGKCIPMEAGALEQFVKGVGYGTAAAMSLWTLGGGSVAAGAKNVYVFIKEGAKIAGTLAKYAVKHPGISAVAGYTLYSIPSADTGQPGICMIEANKNVPAGGWCEKDEHCISGKCVIIPNLSTLSTMQGAKGFGVCGSGESGGSCECAQTGVCADSGGCNAGLWCVDNSDGKYTKSCTDGKADSPCYSDNDCKVSGYKCQYTSAGTKRCMVSGPINESTVCTSDTNCKQAGYRWNCIKGYCSDGTDPKNCCTVNTCTPSESCQSGFFCAFYASVDKQWIQMTNDGGSKLQGYSAYADWQAAYNEKTGRLTQCKPENQVKALP
jgi:hypothetical protein